jgi:two-component system LytT family sensor kinase
MKTRLLILFFVFIWLVPLTGYLIWGEIYFSDWRIALAGSFFNLIIYLITYHINLIIAGFIARLYPDIGQSVYRVLLWFILYSAITISLLYIALTIYDQTGLFGFSIQRDYFLWPVFIILGVSLAGAGLSELAYTFKQWKTNQLELQQLEQKQIQTELEVVKQQVNPHFLFNCLNSLSILISEAPSTAEKFVDEMSKVYRYLLNVNAAEHETNLVTLENEIRFIQSYIYLLKTRYEDGINVKIDVADIYLTGQMGPLTLQTLVDNAVRHNIVSPVQPLCILIRTTATGQLEVKNNLQKRKVRMPFNTSGLTTLVTRYKILFNQAGTIQVKEDETGFAVVLPLIYT